MAERGYPKVRVEERIMDVHRRSQPYRGLLSATQWMYVAASRRNNQGYLDFEGTWTDADPDSPVQFCMDEHGRVRLRGRIAGGAVGTTVFTLPEGFRPSQPQSFNLANGDTGYAILEINTDGTVVVMGVV
jgi:hypothetical protein